MSDRDTFVRNKVMAAYHAAKNFKRPLNEKALRYYKLYRSWRANRHEAGYYHADTGRANLFIPYTFSLIETVTSRTLLSLFAHTPYIGIIPDDADTTIDNAKNMEDLINYQLEEKMNIVMAMADFLKECLCTVPRSGKWAGLPHKEDPTQGTAEDSQHVPGWLGNKRLR